MPRFFARPVEPAVQRWSSGSPLSAASRRPGRLLVGLILALGSGCEREYPLEPTFCDYWCRATLRADCGESAARCVRECELTKASSECLPLQEQLLSCYEGADDEHFVCAGGGFQRENRVTDGVCQSERDTLFECEAPGIVSSCLTPCRVIQAQLNQTAARDQTVARDSEGDGGASCPLLEDSCEAWCWTLFGFSSDQLAALGVPVSATGATPGLSLVPPTVPDSGSFDAGSAADNPLASCVELLLDN